MTAPLTFLFTDLENSTTLWESAPEAMRAALAQHDDLIHSVVDSHGGRVVKDTGDGVLAVFESPGDGIRAALQGQQSIEMATWPEPTGPLKVRMGLHTGESQERDGDYFGRTLNRAARVMGIGHGGQILMTDSTKSLIDGRLPPEASLTHLGEHRLKGIVSPVAIYQLNHSHSTTDFPPLRSLSILQHNLPVQLSTFVGREPELLDVQARLADSRLLTLLGSGGMGKTRLMLQAAEEMVDQYPDGVWLVELAPVMDPTKIAERVAAALHLEEQSDRPMIEAVADFLRQKNLLLLMDNLEHLVTHAARVIQTLLENCSMLSVLATSREPLHIPGEITMPVTNLSLPDPQEDSAVIARADAVKLFVERARMVRSEFDVTAENAAAVAIVVRRLDGIPLALELAAARLRMLSVNQIAERLGDRFRLLTGGRRTSLPRQQTLEAAIGWSWDLLDETERLLLARLSVFAGGWFLEGAQDVTSDEQLDEYGVMDNLEHLVDKSLVVVQFIADGEARYRMLESIRSYAIDRLADIGTVEELRQRHAGFYAAFAAEAAPHLVRGESSAWLKRMIADLDNLRTAIGWLLGHESDMALRITAALFEREALWISPREAGSWLTAAIADARQRMQRDEAIVDESDFARALTALGNVQGMMGEPQAAARTYEESIVHARRVGDRRLVGYAVAMRTLQLLFRMPPGWIDEVERTITMCRVEGFDPELATLLMVAGYYYSFGDDPHSASPYWQESIELLASTGTPHAFLADRMGVFAAVLDGDTATAERRARAWVDRAKSIGARRSTAQGISELAHVLRRNGDVTEAKERYREAIVIWQEVGQLPAVVHEIECLAYIAIAEGQNNGGAVLLGAARAARRQLEASVTDPTEVAELADAMKQLSVALGEKARDSAIASGERLELDASVTLALS